MLNLGASYSYLISSIFNIDGLTLSRKIERKIRNVSKKMLLVNSLVMPMNLKLDNCLYCCPAAQ